MATDELDSLFATPPPGFVEERKRIATALKSAGRKDEAKAVEKIPRPSLAVWTVNQVARRDPALVGRLGAVTDCLQEAAGADYAAAAAEHRQVLAELRRRAAEVPRGPATWQACSWFRGVIANLRAAVGNAETRADAAQGTARTRRRGAGRRQPVRRGRRGGGGGSALAREARRAGHGHES